MKIYIVTCERHIDCQIRNLTYICYAQNAKDACEKAKFNWTGKGHLFFVHAVKSRIQDASLMRVVNFRRDEFKGEEVFGKYICTDYRVWRINGRNLYAN